MSAVRMKAVCTFCSKYKGCSPIKTETEGSKLVCSPCIKGLMKTALEKGVKVEEDTLDPKEQKDDKETK